MNTDSCFKWLVEEEILKASVWYNDSKPTAQACLNILIQLCNARDSFFAQGCFGLVESKNKEIFYILNVSGNASIVMGLNPKLVKPECYSCASQAFLNKP